MSGSEPRPALVLVLASGNGTNLQALLEAEKSGALGPARIGLVIADRPEAYALTRARSAGCPALLETPDPRLPRDQRRRDLSDRILRRARAADADLIVLAGFLSILAGPILTDYAERILNLHPALLPKFGGPGMYGRRVHAAVLSAGERESGCTVHLVDAGTDSGPILLQRRVPVLDGDSPDTLAARIHPEEHRAIVDAVRLMAARIGHTSTPA